ncbi:hypothetical protein [Lentzea sp. E54]|uniref:hypothetical protein n=1 Tax=Lentzea xerophila TaxID=3435883 RepID=UPI003DA214CB
MQGARDREYVEVPVDADRGPVVYAKSKFDAPQVKPASVWFNLPGKGGLMAPVN